MKHSHFREVITFIRPVDAPWFRASSPENLALNDSYSAAEAKAEGFKGRGQAISPDGRKITVILFWRKEADFEKFLAENEVLVHTFFSARAKFYEENGITYSSTYVRSNQ